MIWLGYIDDSFPLYINVPKGFQGQTNREGYCNLLRRQIFPAKKTKTEIPNFVEGLSLGFIQDLFQEGCHLHTHALTRPEVE